MKGLRTLTVAIVLALLTVTAGAVSASERSPKGWSDQLIVTYRSGSSKALPFGVRKVRSSGDRVIVNLGRKAVPSDLKRFTSDDVLLVEPDRWMTATALPDDPRLDDQWGTHDQDETDGGYSVRAEGAWAITTGSEDIRVAVLDTGITAHPELDDRRVAGYDFIGNLGTANDGNGRDADPSDPGDPCYGDSSSWHGTHVAGTIGAEADNGVGITGLNWVSKIQPVRVLGVCGGYTSDVADGIKWAAGGTVSGVPANANPSRVINLSLGGWGACSTGEQAAIDYAVGQGALVVVAAGNDEDDAANYSPANCDDVIVVAATSREGKKSWYSNYGDIVTVAAPGGDDSVDGGILSTLNTGTSSPGTPAYGFYQGTSMATPHVAGVLSLLLSVAPELRLADVLTLLAETSQPFPADLSADSCSDPDMCGVGIIDATALLTAAAAGDTPQEISFSAPADKYLGETPFNPIGTATSTLPVSYSTSPLSVCNYLGAQVHLLGLGTCTIVARQSGNLTYARATAVTRTFEVLAPFAPSVSAAATFNHTPEVGVAVDVTEGTWSGGPAPTLTYQWYRCSAAGVAVTQSRAPSGCSAISRATSLSYTLTTADLGRYLRLGVTAKNLAARRGVINFSVTSGAVVGAPVRARALTVTVSPRVGRAAVAASSAVLGTASINYVYAWYSCTGATIASTTLDPRCSVIDGQTSGSYMPTVDQVGRFLVVSVSASNAFGSIVNYSASSRAVR
jgi:subtilisin family serine protease